ncbi:MAG: C40 family peptidase [Nocardioidaceae bacterium]
MTASLLRRTAAALLLGLASLTLVASPAPAAAPAVTAGHDAWVSVSVARLWDSPSSPRRVDRPALQAPVQVRAWLAAMSVDQRRGLNFLSQSEALMGERVRVRAVRDGWARVVVPDQPTPKDRGGYPGWVPVRQLTARTPASADLVATVVRPTTWLRTDVASPTRVVEVSFGSVFPVLESHPRYALVVTPLGAVRRVRAVAVVVHAPGTPALPRTRASLVSTAQAFTGLDYLWGGLSGFGLDCSGLTWLDFGAHGQKIPRDALPQSRHGRAVARSALRKGDLVFYATEGKVHHVAMYAGKGMMTEAPHTGAKVRTVPLRSFEYFGARRYL